MSGSERLLLHSGKLNSSVIHFPGGSKALSLCDFKEQLDGIQIINAEYPLDLINGVLVADLGTCENPCSELVKLAALYAANHLIVYSVITCQQDPDTSFIIKVP